MNGGLENVAIQIVDHAREGADTRLVVPVNCQVFVTAVYDSALGDVLCHAEYVVADGAPIVFAKKFLEKSHVSRVTGVDLITAICAEANASGLRVLLLGGRPGAAEATIGVLEKKFPDLIFQVNCPPMGFEKSPEQLARIDETIHAFAPHIIFVALGAPKQEFFMDKHLRLSHAPVVMAVGGSFEMISGMVPRAPLWLRKNGMEWIFRLMHEPRRLFKRYLSTNTAFCWLVFKEWLSNL